MSRVEALASSIAPDSIRRLERAAELRYREATEMGERHRLCAVYWLGYCVEMCLTAACFRAAGFPVTVPIDRDTRQRRMAQARQLRLANGEPLMNSDPHPLVGWARYLRWLRSASAAPTPQVARLLSEAVNRAEAAYRHWRPELRYKTVDVAPGQLDELRRAASWFVGQQGRL
jgi:hypothetical protein